MSKKRFTVILCSLLALIAVGILVWKLTDGGLKRVENEHLTTLKGEWEGAKDFSEGLAAVQKNGKWGFIDTEGNLVVEAKYDGAFSFSQGLAAVRSGGRWGFIDKEGKTVISFLYQSVQSFSEDRAVFQQGLYYGYIDKEGRKITDAVYSEASPYREGVACVRQDSAYGFLDKEGNLLTEIIYGESSKASEGLIAVFSDAGKESLKTGFLDLTGKEVLPPTWYDTKEFSEGLCAVQDKAFTTPWGFIDQTGKKVIEGNWDFVESFAHGRAVVHDKDGYRFIDKTGTVIGQTYGKAYSFTESGFARVAKADGTGWDFGFIDENGNEAVGLKYDSARDFYNGAAAVENGGNWFFVNGQGTELCEGLWDDVGDFSAEGIARVRNGETYGFVKLK